MANKSTPESKLNPKPHALGGKAGPSKTPAKASKPKPATSAKPDVASSSPKKPRAQASAPQPLASNASKAELKAAAAFGALPKKAKARKASHGGSRAGAGRPKGSGRLGGRTSSMRTTPELHAQLLAIRNALIAGGSLPGSAPELVLYEAQVAAGFGVPADETASRRVDLYTLFSPKPESTFLVKVAGWSMRGAGIHDGDYLLVDRSIEAKNGHVVVAHVEGQGLVAKRLRIDAGGAFLDSENPDFKPIALGEGSQAKVWGVARAKAGLLI